MTPSGPFSPDDTPVLPDNRRAGSATAGAVPGMRGAPVRTPVLSGGTTGGWKLIPAIAGRLVTRQLWIELYGLPGYGRTLAYPKPNAFAATPRDFRPQDGEIGKALLGGKFALAGAAQDVTAPDTPWAMPSPTRAFAVELHAFSWLPALMLKRERGAREALRLTLGWFDQFARWSPFAWAPDILARRVFNLACAARKMGQVATEAERLRLADMLARQGRQLLRPPGDTAGRAERLIAAALAGSVLAGPAGASIRRKALGRLPNALKKTVLPDGSHASRSPEAAMELLLNLLTLQDALEQLSEPSPEAVLETTDRLTRAMRVLTLPDGRLGAFHGGGPSTAECVAAARAHDEPEAARKGATPPAEPELIGGLMVVRSPLMTVMVDAAAAPHGAWGAAACAQPAALEVVCGRDRLFTSSGWTPRAPDRQALRLTPGASTLTLGERSLGEPLGGWRADLLGPRLDGGDYKVTSDHREGEGALWVEIEHDGWVDAYGLMHQRRLYLDQRLDELRAEERLFPALDRKEVVRAIAAPYAVRFQLEPGVSASLARDKRSILLRGGSGRGWWFRTDGPDVAIEPAVHIDQGMVRRSLQIVVRGSARTDGETKLRWKLGPAGATTDKTATEKS